MPNVQGKNRNSVRMRDGPPRKILKNSIVSFSLNYGMIGVIHIKCAHLFVSYIDYCKIFDTK